MFEDLKHCYMVCFSPLFWYLFLNIVNTATQNSPWLVFAWYNLHLLLFNLSGSLHWDWISNVTQSNKLSKQTLVLALEQSTTCWNTPYSRLTRQEGRDLGLAESSITALSGEESRGRKISCTPFFLKMPWDSSILL